VTPPDAVALEWAHVAGVLDEIGFSGARVVRAIDEGAFSSARRWIIDDGSGETVFVKAAAAANAYAVRELSDQCSSYLRAELAEIVPQLQGWHDGGDGRPAVLVLEDLSDARWGAPVTERDARALRAALDALVQVPAFGDDRPFATGLEPDGVNPWTVIAADRGPAIATGLVDAGWLDASLPALIAAADAIDLEGDRIVHGDLWRQNWCVAPHGAVLVDFGAARGNARINHAWGECAVRAAGGPGGLVLRADESDHASWAAWMSGLALRLIVQSAPRHARFPRLLETERREAIAGLRWASAALHLLAPSVAPGVEPAGPWRP